MDGTGRGLEQDYRNLETKASNVYQNICEDVISKLGEHLVTPMSTIWYTKSGVEFFTAVSEAISASSQGLYDAFEFFLTTTIDAANRWDEKDHNGVFPHNPISKNELVLNIDAIESENPVTHHATILTAEAMNVANGLDVVREEILAGAKSASASLEEPANNVLIGAGQGEAIMTFYDKVTEAVASIFKFIDDPDEGVKACINKAAETTDESGQNVASGVAESGFTDAQ